MIDHVTGTLVRKTERFAVIKCNGVGFKVFSHERALGKLPREGSEVTLYTLLYLREDGAELYGFLTREELEFFDLLNSVAGVGPKSALAVLEVAPLKDLAAAIKENRPDLLTRASGIGRRTAERIILELKGKVRAEASEEAVRKMESDADIVEALANLGYRREEAKAALGKLGEKPAELEARLKAALKVLGRP